MNGTVLVTGARGKTGREVVNSLRSRPGFTVRAGSSQAPDAAGATADNVTPVRFDWRDTASWPAAIDRVDAIYLMRPDVADAPELAGNLVARNPDAHVVLLSEQLPAALPDSHWARRVEDAVTRRTDSWTLLRPSWFHQILTDPRYYLDSIRTDGVVSLPSAGAPIAWVDARDIAAVATAALVTPADHRGQAYTITGPESITVAEVAATLAEYLRRPITAVDPPVETAVDSSDPWFADMITDVYNRVITGAFAEVSSAVADVTGTKPRSLQSFIEAHVDAWG